MPASPVAAQSWSDRRYAGRLLRLGAAAVSTRSLMIASAVLLGVMIAACVLTLPYTLGRATTAPMPDGVSEADRPVHAARRYEHGEIDLALLPPTWAPHQTDEREQLAAYIELHDRAPHFLLGTDRMGRDVLVRLLAGGGISLTIGLAAAGITVVIGTLYGMIAGWWGGRVDAILMRTVDILFGLPTILLVVLIAVAVDGLLERTGTAITPEARAVIGLITLLVAIGSVSWLTMARVIRGQVLSLKQQPFMEACVAIGIPTRKQLTRHLLPNLTGPIVVYATLAVPTAILSESFLSFLGIGVREPLPSWGNLAADGLNELNVVRSRWWLLLWPCLMIALTLLALNFLGEGLRERMDVRRGTVHRVAHAPKAQV
jgi:oligopeptide transport system permease protein